MTLVKPDSYYKCDVCGGRISNRRLEVRTRWPYKVLSVLERWYTSSGYARITYNKDMCPNCWDEFVDYIEVLDE